MKTSITTAALLLSAATASATPLGNAPVVGGTTARNDTAVVALTMRSGTTYCSGTLVSPRVIVTAAHCVYRVEPPAKIFFGTDPAADGLFMKVRLAIAHPDYARNKLADIGLVILERPVTIKPMLLPDGDLTNPALAGMIRLVGFGDREPEDYYGPTGVKFNREVPLTRVEGYFLEYGVGACRGDSGGPTLARDSDGTERLVGVISRGDPECMINGYSTRVDLYRDWIASWIASADPAGCELDMRCAFDCAAPDPDCASGMPSTPPAATDETAGCAAGGAGAGMPLALLALALVLHRRRS